MKREMITITDSGAVIVPNEIKMSITEIADLFDIYYQTAKRTIRAIEKSGIANGDYSMSCTVDGEHIYPDYYGLEMVVAVAFRLKSKNTQLLRNWVLDRTRYPDMMLLQLPENNRFFSLN